MNKPNKSRWAPTDVQAVRKVLEALPPRADLTPSDRSKNLDRYTHRILRVGSETSRSVFVHDPATHKIVRRDLARLVRLMQKIRKDVEAAGVWADEEDASTVILADTDFEPYDVERRLQRLVEIADSVAKDAGSAQASLLEMKAGRPRKVSAHFFALAVADAYRSITGKQVTRTADPSTNEVRGHFVTALQEIKAVMKIDASDEVMTDWAIESQANRNMPMQETE